MRVKGENFGLGVDSCARFAGHSDATSAEYVAGASVVVGGVHVGAAGVGQGGFWLLFEGVDGISAGHTPGQDEQADANHG